MRLIINTLSIGAASIFSIALLCACHDKKDKPTVAPPVRVTVMVANESDSRLSQQFSGTVASSENTTVSFAVAGTITDLLAEEGQKVTKGQLLGKVRDGDYINALNIAEAELAEAQDGYDRLKKLHDANALPEVKWVEMQQKLKQAQNAVEMAQRTLNDARLHSPVSGTVTRRLADVGQTVLPVQPVYEIVSTDNLTIDISVSENQIGQFETGQEATIDFYTSGLPQIKGKITQKSVVADPVTRGYTIKIAIPSENGKILPGMIANVTFDSVATDSCRMAENIVIPSQALLLNEDNRFFVWVVSNGKAERRFVEADELTTGGVIVKSGLMPADSVIIEGMQKVGTGTEVISLTK